MCHLSHVTCHMSHVTCHVSHVTFFLLLFSGLFGEAYRWRVCYQRGLPRLVSIDLKSSQNFKKSYCENQKNYIRFSVVDLRALLTPYFRSLDIEIFLSEPRAELLPRLQKWFAKHPSKKFFSSKFLNLSTGLPRPWSPPEISARCHYRLSIKNLTAHYNSQFCVSFNFLLRKKPENASKHVWIGP